MVKKHKNDKKAAEQAYNKERAHEVKLTREGWMAGGYHIDTAYFQGGGKPFKVIGNIYQNAELLK